MFLMDVRDFRQQSDYEVVAPEEAVYALLQAAGEKFDSPLSVKVRVKDLDARWMVAKAEFVGAGCRDSVRVNLYLPACDKPPIKYMDHMNRELCHLFKHITQVRLGREEELFDLLEAEAEEFAKQNQLTTVTVP